MKATILVFFYCCILFTNVTSQTLSGKILHAESDSAIIGASVYFSGSMSGTKTDNKGEFNLAAKDGTVPVTISHVGFHSETIDKYFPGNSLIVHLKPKDEQLREVVIRTSDMSRKEMVKLFTKEFIGESYFAQNCTIININEVSLFYDKESQILTADCDKPIVIENRLLGYSITYYLNSFIKTPENVQFSGSFIFKETVGVEQDWRKFKQNRERAYEGSRMQLVRALSDNTLHKTKFQLYTPSYEEVKVRQIVISDEKNQKYLRFRDKIFVVYKNDFKQKSSLSLNEDSSFISKNGFYSLGLRWRGPLLSKERIGDLLPYEYKPEKEKESNTIEVTQKMPDKKIITTPQSTNISLTFEKAYLHTDRDIYLPGDDVWFKAYLLDAQSNQLSDHSNTLYVELINPGSKIISRHMLRMENGIGNGDFKLVDNLSPGSYRLRAYTNWMRNFGDDFIFEKSIRVLPVATVATANTIRTENTKPVSQLSEAARDVTKEAQARFFPEGGSLIDGLASMVAVRAEDAYGRAIPAIGEVLGPEGEILARFSCDSLGMGAFTLLPAMKEYKASVSLQGRKASFTLPQVKPSGFSISVRSSGKLITSAAVNCNEAALGVFSGQQFTTLIKNAGKEYFRQVFQLKDKGTLITVPYHLLPEGIACISLLGPDSQPLSERLVYVHHVRTAQLSIQADKAEYRPKEKVTINLFLNTNEKASLSMAVVDADVVPVQQENIATYLNLRSELRGRIESPRRYFDTTNVNRYKQLDLLLLTQGWRDFVWKRLEDTAFRFAYKREKAISITGKVRKVGSKVAVSGMNITMFANGATGQKLFSAFTDSAGRFAIDGAVFYGNQFLSFTSRNSEKMKSNGINKGFTGGWIQVDSLGKDTLRLLSDVVIKVDSLPTIIAALIEKEKVRKKFSFGGVNELADVVVMAKNLNTFPPVTYSITLTEHKSYDNVLQYLLSHIPGARIIHSPDGEPLLVDGNIPPLPIIAAREMFTLPLEKVLSINIQKYIDMSANVRYRAFAKLRPGALDSKNYFDNTVVDMMGYSKSRIFYAPRFETADEKVDERTNTIHWEPLINTDEKGEAVITFYNNDSKSKAKVTIEGITDSGKPVGSTVIYEVK